MKPYTTPILRQMGRMDSVTRKSGPYYDTGGEPGGPTQRFPRLCEIIWIPWLCDPNGGTGGISGTSGSGSFEA